MLKTLFLSIVPLTYALYGSNDNDPYRSSFQTSSISSSPGNIHNYGWQSSPPVGLTFTNFGGGTDGPFYQYEQTFTRSCGLGCSQTARASDFGRLDSRHLHPDHNYMHVDYDRHYDYDFNPGPD